MKEVFVLIFMFITITIQAQLDTTHSLFLTTNDSTRLFVKKVGEGPVCIFIHGGPGAWSKSFEDLKGAELEAKLSMVYFDQRGSGRSDNAKNEDYSLNQMVEDIESIRKHYKADKVYLLAHSFGGILAVNYALKYPNRLKGVILANSTLNLSNSLQNQIDYINELLATNFIPSDSSISSIMSTFQEARKSLASKGLSYKMISDIKEHVTLLEEIDKTNPGKYEFARHALTMDDYWKDYTKITNEIDVPVLIITGKKDYSIGIDHYQSFNFRKSKTVSINGGHLLYYDKNRRFIKAIFRFVKANE